MPFEDLCRIKAWGKGESLLVLMQIDRIATDKLDTRA